MSKSRVLVLDYGVGNVLSVCRGLASQGGDVVLSGDASAVANADRVVLPGVGAFGAAMARLAEHRLVEAIQAFAEKGRPMLGICLGMQMLLDRSEEFGYHAGLGLLPGRVTAIPQGTGIGHKIPHIGWNRLAPSPAARTWDSTILNTVPPGAYVYFVHSYVAQTDSPLHSMAVTHYNGLQLTAVIGRDAIWGCQFHPEKSGPIGLSILRAFLSA